MIAPSSPGEDSSEEEVYRAGEVYQAADAEDLLEASEGQEILVEEEEILVVRIILNLYLHRRGKVEN